MKETQIAATLRLLLDLGDFRALLARASPDILVMIDASGGQNLPGQQLGATVAQIDDGLAVITNRLRERLADDPAQFVEGPLSGQEEEFIVLLARAFAEKTSSRAASAH
jgi:hypothetical protein